MYNKLVAELVMGRVGYGRSLSWAEFVMGQDVQLPFRAYTILLPRSPISMAQQNMQSVPDSIFHNFQTQSF